ncbi:MAG TPA: C25 family cysteine peptidase, partial [Candidatus Saccharimonadales bacterium]|nr:C25 family cysteine peptidase [Candidatus Saccharimonadales bacterium]
MKTFCVVAMAVCLFAPVAVSTAALHEKLLVLAPNSFHPVLREFVTHKQKLLPTELVSLESVLRTSLGGDDPEKVKRYLFSQWKDHEAGFVLLVGDVDVFPVRYMVLDRATSAAFDYAFYPCDLYYADVARRDGSFDDWNAQKEGFHA